MESFAHILIFGKVQGVFYRVEAKRKALEFGLSGWVKNLEDGSVEIFVQGDKKEIKELIEWCRKGPRRSFVEEVKVEWSEECDYKKFDNFQIMY